MEHIETAETLFLAHEQQIADLSPDQLESLLKWTDRNAGLPAQELRERFRLKVVSACGSRARTEQRDVIRRAQLHIGQESGLGVASPHESVPVHFDRPIPPARDLDYREESDESQHEPMETKKPRTAARTWLKSDQGHLDYAWQLRVFLDQDVALIHDVREAVQAAREIDPLGVGALLAVFVLGYSWADAAKLSGGGPYRLPPIRTLMLTAEGLRKRVERKTVPMLRKRLKRLVAPAPADLQDYRGWNAAFVRYVGGWGKVVYPASLLEYDPVMVGPSFVNDHLGTVYALARYRVRREQGLSPAP